MTALDETPLDLDGFTPDPPPPDDDAFVPCSSKNDWCRLPDGHKGRCRRYPEGTSRAEKDRERHARKRSAGAGTRSSSRAVQRPRRTSKPTLAPAVLGMAYGQIGSIIEVAAPEPAGPPIGRVMQFQAPLAGQQLDALLANLPIYKRVTRAGSSQLVEQIASLIAAPLLAGVMASNEAAARTLYPIFASAIRSAAVEIVKAQKQQVEAMAEIDEYSAEADELTRQFLDVMLAPREPAEAPDA